MGPKSKKNNTKKGKAAVFSDSSINNISDNDDNIEVAFDEGAPLIVTADESFAPLPEDALNVDEDGNDLGGLMSIMSKLKKNGKGGKKAKKQRLSDDEEDAAAILAKLDALEAAEKEQTVVEKPSVVTGKNKKAGGKKGKKNQHDSDDEDAANILEKLHALELQEKENSLTAKIEKTFDNITNKKKGGKKSKKNQDSDEEDAAAILEKLDVQEPAVTTPVVTLASVPKKTTEKATPTVSLATDDNDGDDTGLKIKSKKEKEKERKERQKQAEKAKKVEAAALVQAAVAASPVSKNDEEEEEADADGGVSSKNKKKKKKPAVADEEPVAPAPATKKKGGAIGALQQMLAAKKAAEEEAKRLEEEERRRIEEEEAREAALEKAKAEAKALKKEREKQKIEELKKAGKYQTPAQKQAAAIAAQRLQAMLAAGGAKVEALEKKTQGADDDSTDGRKPKRVVYGKKKKMITKTIGAETKSEEADSQKAAENATAATVLAASKAEEAEARIQAEALKLAQATLFLAEGTKKPNANWNADEGEEVKDSWDASSEDEAKDNWDDESDNNAILIEMGISTQVKATPVPVKATIATSVPVSTKDDSIKTQTSAKSIAPLVKPIESIVVSKSLDPNTSRQVEAGFEQESEEENDEDEGDEEEDESEEESDDDSESENEGPKMSVTKRAELQRKLEAARKREAAHQAALKARSKDDLRSPICCILGHVDTGKTKVLDKIRQTNVQEGEAGGITQQIGATFFPMEAIRQKTARLHNNVDAGYKLPGLLIIDTPGHESFTNLRSRGSSLCNIAVLVVDIMHGLEPQTIESLGLLRQRKTPFIVALNKIDRIYGWKSIPDCPVQESLKQQPDFVIAEFNERVEKTKVAFAEQGLNAELYFHNKNIAKYVSLVPTSAITGEGIPDLLHLLVDLTQNRLTESLMYLSELECTVLEVKVIEGLGTTIDVVLSNGILREGDKIIVCGLNGPIVTNVRALLTPEPMRELRIKSAYVHHKEVRASLGVKISAPGLEKAIAGSRLMVIKDDDDVEDFVEEIMSDFTAITEKFITPGRGVCVQASTLGSLEALLTFLKASNIPVSGYNIGPVHKKDIIRTSIMLDKHRELAMLLAFDVAIDRDAEELAESNGIKIFRADIIYHLFDQFTAHMKAIDEQKKKDAAPNAVFPCILRIIPGMVFNKRSPILMGVDVVEGCLKIGTPICVVDENKHITSLGKCTGIELNKKPLQECKRGGPSVSIKLEVPGYDTPKMFGRHFTQENDLYSHISRASIDILKTTFRNDLTMDDWKTVKKIKGILNIPDM